MIKAKIMPLFRLGSIYKKLVNYNSRQKYIFFLVITGTVELRNAGQPLLAWVTRLSHYTAKKNIT
jgi:hypothetical protein